MTIRQIEQYIEKKERENREKRKGLDSVPWIPRPSNSRVYHYCPEGQQKLST
jgi:hypothetical protein